MGIRAVIKRFSNSRFYKWFNQYDLIFSHVWRGFLYAFTSIAALVAGYLIKSDSYNPRDLLVLIVPMLVSIFFFLCYSAHFPIPDQPDDDVTQRRLFRAHVYAYALFVLPTSAFALHLATDQGISVFSLSVLSIIVQAFLYFGYGIFLWIQARRNITLPIRHQIVWPVILAIGLSLYNGLSYPRKDASWHILIPVIVIFGLFCVTTFTKIKIRKTTILFKQFQFNQKWFLIVAISAFLVSTGLALYFRGTDKSEYVLTMLSCVIISAYLAVFETWKITSDLLNPRDDESRGKFRYRLVKSTRYSLATLWGAMVSVWALPVFYVFTDVFTDYGYAFLILFSLHAFATFLAWYYWGEGGSLKNGWWRLGKFLAGASFLVILAWGSVRKEPPSDELLTGYDFTVVLALMILGFAGIIAIFGLEINSKKGSFVAVFADRVNFPRLLWFLCGAGAFVMILITNRFPTGSSVHAKGQYAFAFYAVTMFICFVVEVFHRVKSARRGNPVISLIYGFLVLIRSVTSLIIGLVVFVPSIYTGSTIYDALLKSLPFVLSAIGGFSLNDYFDVEKDSITKPYRTLPSGTFSSGFVLGFACLAISAAAICAIVTARDTSELVLYFLCILGVATYNFFVKYLSLSKTMLTSLVSSIPVLFTTYSLEYPVIYLLLPIATCFFVLGREWLMDIRDMEGDSAGGTRTIPMILGVKKTAVLGIFFQFFAASLLIPIGITVGSWWAISIVVAIYSILIISAPFWTFHSGVYRRPVIQLLWLPMFLGILLFIR